MYTVYYDQTSPADISTHSKKPHHKRCSPAGEGVPERVFAGWRATPGLNRSFDFDRLKLNCKKDALSIKRLTKLAE